MIIPKTEFVKKVYLIDRIAGFSNYIKSIEGRNVLLVINEQDILRFDIQNDIMSIQGSSFLKIFYTSNIYGCGIRAISEYMINNCTKLFNTVFNNEVKPECVIVVGSAIDYDMVRQTLYDSNNMNIPMKWISTDGQWYDFISLEFFRFSENIPFITFCKYDFNINDICFVISDRGKECYVNALAELIELKLRCDDIYLQTEEQKNNILAEPPSPTKSELLEKSKKLDVIIKLISEKINNDKLDSYDEIMKCLEINSDDAILHKMQHYQMIDIINSYIIKENINMMIYTSSVLESISYPARKILLIKRAEIMVMLLNKVKSPYNMMTCNIKNDGYFKKNNIFEDSICSQKDTDIIREMCYMVFKERNDIQIINKLSVYFEKDIQELIKVLFSGK